MHRRLSSTSWRGEDEACSLKTLAVKAALVKQFENAKLGTQHIPAEAASVAHIEAAINALLDSFDPKSAIKVAASGSCGAREGLLGSAGLSVQFETLYGFVE